MKQRGSFFVARGRWPITLASCTSQPGPRAPWFSRDWNGWWENQSIDCQAKSYRL